MTYTDVHLQMTVGKLKLFTLFAFIKNTTIHVYKLVQKWTVKTVLNLTVNIIFPGRDCRGQRWIVKETVTIIWLAEVTVELDCTEY